MQAEKSLSEHPNDGPRPWQFAMGEAVLVTGSGFRGEPGTIVDLIPEEDGPRYRVVFEDGSEANLSPGDLHRRNQEPRGASPEEQGYLR